MEKIRREIKLFWTRNGKLLLQIIGSISLVILVIQGANQYVIMQNKQKEKETLAHKEEREQEKIKQNIDKEYINVFLDYCKNDRIEEAYNMLSENCKKEKYPTIDFFKKNYINKIYNYKREYQITLQNDIYKITFLEDILQSGKVENRKQLVDYYSVNEDVLGEKTIIINLYNNI